MSRFEQARVSQLVSLYAPQDPPRTPLDFGDLLSLLWRIDHSGGSAARERYYKRSAFSLAVALNLRDHPVYRFMEMTAPGELYTQFPNLVYRIQGRALDAHDRKAALEQLMQIRNDIMRVGSYPDKWTHGWPGSGIQDVELRERVFAVLFTALQGQFPAFGRLLLVNDIVIANLIIGFQPPEEIPLTRLVAEFGYPDPTSPALREAFAAEEV